MLVSGERTHAGKSSSQLIAIVQHRDSILPDLWLPIPLVPEPMHVRGARKWFDEGRPENVDEYKGWR